MGSVSWIPRIGEEFAGYRLVSLIGHGGMSIVYRAEHIGLERTVALKLLSPQVSEDEDFRERFQRESEVAAALEHPNIIPIYEAGEENGVLYIAMRYVEGADLKSRLKQDGPLEAHQVVLLISQVAAALEAAHDKGLVHRDVKPANILIASGAGVEGSTTPTCRTSVSSRTPLRRASRRRACSSAPPTTRRRSRSRESRSTLGRTSTRSVASPMRRLPPRRPTRRIGGGDDVRAPLGAAAQADREASRPAARGRRGDRQGRGQVQGGSLRAANGVCARAQAGGRRGRRRRTPGAGETV